MQGYLCRKPFHENLIPDIQSIRAKVWRHDYGAEVVITKDKPFSPGNEPFIPFDNAADGPLVQSRSSLPEFEQGVSNQKALNIINGFLFFT
jgi:hypothetical protein